MATNKNPIDEKLTVKRTDDATMRNATNAGPEGAAGREEIAIPVVKEELAVGKREVERGAVRVDNRVVEEPVEQRVNLREEHVRVERHPVNRDASPSEVEKMMGGSVELVERAEEVVVAKQARIIEEVVVSKEVGQRTETVRDTVRHNEVTVSGQAPTGAVTGAAVGTTSDVRTFDAFGDEFRNHYTTNNYLQTGYSYDQFAPAYRYGYDLASSDRYRGRDWSTFETDARSSWEERNPGTWDSVKNAVRHAWDKVTNKA